MTEFKSKFQGIKTVKCSNNIGFGTSGDWWMTARVPKTEDDLGNELDEISKKELFDKYIKPMLNDKSPSHFKTAKGNNTWYDGYTKEIEFELNGETFRYYSEYSVSGRDGGSGVNNDKIREVAVLNGFTNDYNGEEDFVDAITNEYFEYHKEKETV